MGEDPLELDRVLGAFQDDLLSPRPAGQQDLAAAYGPGPGDPPGVQGRVIDTDRGAVFGVSSGAGDIDVLDGPSLQDPAEAPLPGHRLAPAVGEVVRDFKRPRPHELPEQV